MTCSLALKRPLEFNDHIRGDSPKEIKRARTAFGYCSPFPTPQAELIARMPSSKSNNVSLANVHSQLATEALPFVNNRFTIDEFVSYMKSGITKDLPNEFKNVISKRPVQEEVPKIESNGVPYESLKSQEEYLINKTAVNSHIYHSNFDKSFFPNCANNNSSFCDVSEKISLTEGQLESYLRAEVRYLRRRHLIARRLRNYDPLENFENTLGKLEKSVEMQNKMIGNHNPQNVYRSPNSPTGSTSSDSDGESFALAGRNIKAKQLSQEMKEKPQFSIKEVRMICERLLKQQEAKLRYEYETVIADRLQMKHDEYVEMAEKELVRQRETSAENLSYLS